MKKLLTLFISIILFTLSISLVSALLSQGLSSVTINRSYDVHPDNWSISRGNITGNTSTIVLGTTYSYVIEQLDYTDASGDNTVSGGGFQNCNESVRLHHGKGNTNSASAYININSTITSNSKGKIGYTIDADRVFVEFKPHFNSSAGNCTYNAVSIGYSGGLGDLMEGLPAIGSDTGAFLSNLAPGVGAFILIMGVFTGIAGIVLAIVFVVRRRMGTGQQ